MTTIRSFALLALATFLLAGASVPQATAAADCKARALDVLRTASPDGYAIYRRIADKRFFTGWIRCDEAQLSLPTAVHESVHFITAEADAYPVIGGEDVKRPREDLAFFPPSRIAAKFKRSVFVDTYLKRGGSSSATEFRYLLDELNAYTHDLHTALSLIDVANDGDRVMHRDGLSALMAFTATYVQAAEEGEPATWANLRRPEVAKAVSELWTRAEVTMASSCRVPGIGQEDKGFLKQVCQPKAQGSLSTLLGRPAVCPSACLDLAPRTAEAQ